jgi:XTP/dITP diphosphohydrolase
MSSQQLLIATGNRGKMREFRALLADLPIELCDLNSFPQIATVEETGRTFFDNASLKATGYALQAGVMTLADDSGLEVEALGGAPGVRSARYAGSAASDSKRIEKLLSELSAMNAPNRNARFVSVVAIADPSGKILNVSSGQCTGTITAIPRGENGFGYDPVFLPDGFDRTFGELPAEVKNQISHRARAFEGTANFLRSLTLHSSAG